MPDRGRGVARPSCGVGVVRSFFQRKSHSAPAARLPRLCPGPPLFICGKKNISFHIRDIREAHKKDSESAPQTTVADELKENLEAVENFKGSRDEKLVVLYCKQLGINYKNLSDEEFRWLIRILKKSKKMGTPISQRKKR